MKLIIAIIQPDKLLDVKEALFKSKIYKMTVSNVIGAGTQKGYKESYRGVITDVNLLKKIKIEIVVNDDTLETVIDTIIKSAWTGNIGDGKIFVIDVVDCIKIRTNERGYIAV